MQTGLPTTLESWWDILRRVWNQAAEDNVPFLAGGLAFNILLALVPFVLLLISGLSFLLGSEPAEAAVTVTRLIEQLLPNEAPSAGDLLRGVVTEVLSTRGTVTIYSAIIFAWFSTRLFGSLRSVLALIFDGTDRSIVAGKLFDFLATIVATVAVVVYVVFSAYLDLATTRGFAFLRTVGLQRDAMSGLEYVVGRLLAVLLVFALFYAFYRGLPRRRPSVQVAAVAALTASILFEIARHVFALAVGAANPASLYTGTNAASVAVVVRTDYRAVLALRGGEVAQAYDLRRAELAALRDGDARATRVRPR
ncbi:YihY/virulence factor BrkB family protein [Gemmatimonas sp.]|uniref:YihY/virulence factor BrkB family protein n=1 Tax=Gemmatimonas sp. TaxID=1962908 RepID=UPI00391943E3